MSRKLSTSHICVISSSIFLSESRESGSATSERLKFVFEEDDDDEEEESATEKPFDAAAVMKRPEGGGGGGGGGGRKPDKEGRGRRARLNYALPPTRKPVDQEELHQVSIHICQERLSVFPDGPRFVPNVQSLSKANREDIFVSEQRERLVGSEIHV